MQSGIGANDAGIDVILHLMDQLHGMRRVLAELRRELAERKTKWAPRATNHTSGALWKYAQQVGPAVDGAVTHPGGAHEKQCYADI